MAKITNRDNLAAWLEGKPHEVATIIAMRAVLRVLPMSTTVPHQLDKPTRREILLPCFRALAYVSFANIWPDLVANTYNYGHAATLAAAIAADAAAGFKFANAVTDVARATAAADNTLGIRIAVRATATAANIDSAVDSAVVDLWSAVTSDSQFVDTALNRGETVMDIAVSISSKPLWFGKDSEPLVDDWAAFSNALNDADEGWEVWTNWYEARLHGALSSPLLDRARALIPDKDWKQGPAHVNAIIKRLIEEHEGDTTFPMEQENTIPRLPNPLPSPSNYIAHNGNADLVEATTLPVPSNSSETAWEVLKETLSDLQQSCGHNAPTVTASLNRVACALGTSPQEVDVVRCGMAWLELRALAEVTDSILMGEAVAQVKSLAVQLGVFSAQFEDWREFFAQLPDVVSGQGSLNEAAKLVGELHSNLAECGNLTDPANEQLTAEHQAALPGSAEFDHAPVPALETKAGFVRSGLALIRAFAVDVLKEVRKLAVKGIAGLTVGTIGGSATVLLAQSETILKLANTLPAEWSWAADLIMWLRALVGG